MTARVYVTLKKAVLEKWGQIYSWCLAVAVALGEIA